VTLECLFLCNELSRLVGADEKWAVTSVCKDGLVSESLGVVHEDVTLTGSIEIIELVTVKNTEFGSVRARYEGLLHFPSYWANVTVLGETLLHVDSVDVHVLHDAWAFFRKSSAVVMHELHAGFQGCLQSFKSDVTNKPS